jgi:hypothetical protein
MALDIHVPSLGDAEQGKDYDYKSRCEELESALNETRSALDEFQLSSRELEAELEKELENMERQYKDAKRQKERLKMESDDWKVQPPTHLPPPFEEGAEFVGQVSASKDGTDAEYECYAEGD